MSDAAPLPRLGEVFFDVRGNSRSMRLSWYADTGVAVFSIWQAGMCTGTFRLPIGDLSRMIQILERGPSPQGRGQVPVSGPRRGPERGHGEYPSGEDEISLLDATYGSQGYDAGYEPAGYEHSGYAEPDRGGASYGGPGSDQRGDDRAAGRSRRSRQDGYGPESGFGGPQAAGGADYATAAYPAADYGSGQPAGREPADYHPDAYGRGAGTPASRTGERPAPGYDDRIPAGSSPDYLSGSHESQPAFPPGGGRRDDGRFAPDAGGPSSAETYGTGYLDERFVPPYVQGGGESYRNDNRAGGAGYVADLEDPGYPADGPRVSSAKGYDDPPWPGEAYSYGAEYRHR